LFNSLLKAHDLLPEPIAFRVERDHPLGHRGEITVPTERFAAPSLDRTEGAHPFGVGGPLARSTDSVSGPTGLRFVNTSIMCAAPPGLVPGRFDATSSRAGDFCGETRASPLVQMCNGKIEIRTFVNLPGLKRAIVS
jgi:hypothetical protein